MPKSRLAALLLLVFVASGFAGLIYQSIWSHYLGLVLGHAAYAQTLVLAMFMGGMALGAWLVSRYIDRLRRLVMGYAAVEAVIGVFGLGFHAVFVGYVDLSQEVVIPALGGGATVTTWQWMSAAALIAPQTVLLGATFPLLSNGLLRLLPGEQHASLGGLYFTNSIGAAVGVLASTFVLLPAMGMPGAMAVAGVLNLGVAAAAWWLSRAMREAELPRLASAPAGSGQSEAVNRLVPVVLGATFFSSAASFVYEIGWVRLLNQALGSTLHTFELMLAAFIAGMAFGGLWVRRRGERIQDDVRYAGYVQVWMGIAALASVPLLSQTFGWVGWLVSALDQTDSGYTLYALGTAVIALLVMFPAAFFAGMTLPLFTSALLKAGAGERAIGRVYAWNTLGAIVGVLAAVHVLIPTFGVSLSVTAAAMLDATIGLLLLRSLSPGRWAPGVVVAALALGAVFVTSLGFGQLDPRAQASGVFRTGNAEIAEGTEVVFLRDGKTATISATAVGSEQVNISTNGKPDASMVTFDQPPVDDEITMIMAGALPLALKPDAERVGIIGWGSGLSTHTVLGLPSVREVNTIEIEPAMWEGAKVFGSRVARAYEDPRSQVRFDDARTYFASGAQKYDVIISEPSNPWVAGVSGLFTHEFYGFLRRHLTEDGLLVQWIQSYEIDGPITAQMFAALAKEFPHVQVYVTNSYDLLLVASAKPIPLEYDGRLWAPPELRSELERVGLRSAADFEVRRVGDRAVLEAIAVLYAATPHSDFHPTVALQAPRTRFRGLRATELQSLAGLGLPVLEPLLCRSVDANPDAVLAVHGSPYAKNRYFGGLIAAAMRGEGIDPVLFEHRDDAVNLVSLLRAEREAGLVDAARHSRYLAALAGATLGELAPENLVGVWIAPSWLGEVSALPETLQRQLAVYDAAARRDYAQTMALADALLDYTPQDLHPTAREQVLLLAMGSALAQGQNVEVRALELRHGRYVAAGSNALARSMLMAYAATGNRACVARSAGEPASSSSSTDG